MNFTTKMDDQKFPFRKDQKVEMSNLGKACLSAKRSPTLKLKVRLSLSGYIRDKTYLTF
jgi:hypothetical protein